MNARIFNRSFKSLRTASLFVFLFWGVFSRAETVVESEFELFLPRKFQQNLIDTKWKDLLNKEFQLNWQFPDQAMTSEQGIHVQLQGVSLQIQTILEKPLLGSAQNDLELQSRDLQAQMVISNVFVDQDIIKTVGGITGQFHIKAQCHDVTLNLKKNLGDFKISLKPEILANQGRAEVQDISLAWQSRAWVAQDFQCSGAEGFVNLVQQEVQKISADSAAFINPHKAQMISYLQQYMNSKEIDFSQPRKILSGRTDVDISMVVDRFDDTNLESILVKGRLIIRFTRNTKDERKYLNLLLNNSTFYDHNVNQAQLRLPVNFVKEMVAQSYVANSWIHKFSSDKISGFSSLMSSRFMQFFVWPELMRYPKNSLFEFDFYSDKDVLVSGKGLQYRLSMNLLTKMLAPQNGSFVAFMNFSTPLQSQLQLSVQDGLTRVQFSNTALSLRYQWDSQYIKNFSPRTRFSASMIQSRILSSLSSSGITFQLPKIPLSEGLMLGVKSVRELSNAEILLRLAP